ncbi:hypothetical protein [Croceimicrobium hydrocarbonivorans]|uniref:Uncharacterized protein n=1 Tax=Croceimicrobium hydrocarbonivorans TaxID=2761580 RepID=A0A7H0VHJ5_9FLAO|nr:hypothetical protein [Croceimicrobium hydrocarbonivorans]QNR25193.1 hypothetical protein H4K34_04960 [Croceimicrobium hydrocarbonivorans]
MSTLKNSSWNINHANTGSNGTLSLSDNTTGTYKANGGAIKNIVWGEAWNGDTCALWVLFQESMQRDCIHIWGIEMTMAGGKGMSAFGNASPMTPTDTGYVNDNLTISPLS